ncbi:hypothetical protein BV898_05155 [Hypsibius exemplaris]|uniref:Uncharacterized protein n=1 Tax=Hypsibius exemplaris TaxID=2072580 RepID=A0A1W0X028_HYPEX|nr:hypothetical protein BV898_05155 [Hypsibius exemplaris]
MVHNEAHDEYHEEERFFVEHLSDSVVPSKQTTGVADRIHNRRHAFFEDQRQKLIHLLEEIGRDAEAKIEKTIQHLYIAMDESGKRLSTSLKGCDPQTAGTKLSLIDFQNAATQIEYELTQRRSDLATAQAEVTATETARKDHISEAFDAFMPKMLEKSHLLAHDVSRLMEQELLAINQIVLRNRRIFVSLFESLLVEAITKAKQGEETVKMYRSEWREFRLQQALVEVKQQLDESCTLRSEDVDVVLEKCLENQRPLLWTMVTVLREREDMVPPEITVARCRDWLKQAEATTTDVYDAALEAAEKQAQMESDLQFYTLEVNYQKDRELALQSVFFAFIHGLAWNWELHLTSVAKSEDFLDEYLVKQRTAMRQLIDAKGAKLRTILENIRHSWSQSVTSTNVHAANNTVADLNNQLRDVWINAQEFFKAFPTLINIISRGYRQRLCAYLQVSLDNPTPTNIVPSNTNSEMSNTSSSLSHHAAMPHFQASSSSTVADQPIEKPTRKLPDIAIEEAEKIHLQDLGLTTIDVENLAIRLKSMLAFQDDPRAATPTTVLQTQNGTMLFPCPAALTDCFRFTKVKDPTAQSQAHDRSIVVETESQIAMTSDLTVEVPNRFKLVDLSSLVNALPDYDNEVRDVSQLQARLTVLFLSHALDEWDAILVTSVESWLETKKEAFELDIQTRLRCLAVRTAGFIDAVVKQRAVEVVKHEELFKALETLVTGTVSDWKLIDIGGVNKSINERLLITRENMFLLEKGLVNTSRLSQIDIVKKRLKKFPEGGSYALDEWKHYEQLLQKFIDKLTASEKSILEEARAIETKRKAVMDAFFKRVSEKVPAHEADVAAVETLTGLLARTQAAIKKQAALVNLGFNDVKKKIENFKAASVNLQKDLTTSKVSAESTVDGLLSTLHEMRAFCSDLGCLTPLWTVSSPSNSVSTNASRDNSLSSPQLRVSTSGSANMQSSTTPGSSLQQHESTIERTSVPSPRHSSGFQRAPVIRSKVESVREIPTDFQLITADGAVPLVAPRTLALFDVKGIGINRGGASPVNGRGSLTTNTNIAAQKRKQKRLERYLVFGEAPFGEPKTFIEAVHVICWEALNDGLNYSEEYHRVRGSRAITRPGLIPETFETTAEKLCKKFLNYLTQSEQFALVMMEKFRDLSDTTRALVMELAPLLFRRILLVFRQELALEKRLLHDEFTVRNARVSDCRQDVEDIIERPQLLLENDVDGMLLEISQRTVAQWTAVLRKLTTHFFQQLNGTAEKLFTICDLVLSAEEVRPPVTPPTLTIRPQPRLSVAATTTSLPEDSFRSEPGQIWKALLPGVPESVDSEGFSRKDVISLRTTMAHLAVEDARHGVFAEFSEIYTEISQQVQAFAPHERIPSDEVAIAAFQRLQLKRLQVLDILN